MRKTIDKKQPATRPSTPNGGVREETTTIIVGRNGSERNTLLERSNADDRLLRERDEVANGLWKKLLRPLAQPVTAAISGAVVGNILAFTVTPASACAYNYCDACCCSGNPFDPNKVFLGNGSYCDSQSNPCTNCFGFNGDPSYHPYGADALATLIYASGIGGGVGLCVGLVDCSYTLVTQRYNIAEKCNDLSRRDAELLRRNPQHRKAFFSYLWKTPQQQNGDTAELVPLQSRMI